MGMAFAEAGTCDLRETGLLAQLFEIAGTGVAHARTQAADQLRYELMQRPGVSNTSLDTFGHVLAVVLG